MNKEKFRAYEKVRASGVVNMWDVKSVCNLSGLVKKDCFDIMRNYSQYKAIYGDKNE